MKNNDLFREYFDSIFGRSNIFSKEEYEQHRINHEMNYGKFLPSDRNSRILDIGCGAGHFLYFLKKKGFDNFLGIDISQQQVDFCRKNVSEQVERADALEFLKDRSKSYGMIVANDVLEHIPKDKVIPFLSLIYNALKSSGIFLMKVPNLGNPFAIRLRYVDFTHAVGFTEKSLYQVLWIAGFRNIQILPLQEKGFKRRIFAGTIRFCLGKLMWHQGFVAPRILTPLLVGVARK